MKKSEQAAVVRIIRHMQDLQRQISEPTHDDATEEEVLKLIELLWEWTPIPNKRLPSKHVMENLVGLMRGRAPREYCYINRQRVAEIIRKAAHNKGKMEPNTTLNIYLKNGYQDMSDGELYEDGRWNYKETPLVQLLFDLHCNPYMFDSDGEKNC